MINRFINNKGISSVISVILIVAVTVALVTIATVIVFDLTDNTSEPADTSIQVSDEGDGLETTIIRSDNVDEFKIKGPE